MGTSPMMQQGAGSVTPWLRLISVERTGDRENACLAPQGLCDSHTVPSAPPLHIYLVCLYLSLGSSPRENWRHTRLERVAAGDCVAWQK